LTKFNYRGEPEDLILGKIRLKSVVTLVVARDHAFSPLLTGGDI